MNPGAGLVGLAKAAGIARLVLNGSFVTDVPEPNDVDCVLLMGPGFPADRGAEAELLNGLPFLEIQLVPPSAFLHASDAILRHGPSNASQRHGRGTIMISNDKSDLRYMQEKLRMLEDGYKTAKADTTCDPHVQEIELRSLKQLINQLKEEIGASRFMLEPSDRGLHTKNSRMVPGGILIHDMNRGIGRTRLFLKKGDFPRHPTHSRDAV